jgi:peptidoglycan hydrolase-like protein with peptidoglycan-binding domain
VKTGTERPNRGLLLSASSGLRGKFLRYFWIMRLSTVGCVAILATALSSAQDAKTDSKPAATPAIQHSASHSKKSKKTRRSASRRTRGQQKIDAKRTQEIQEALIREHYLEGKPTGVWNDATQKAMQRYQADNNWQSKTTPDARALIKLGLGPDHQHLLNPESAMTTQPQGTHDASISSSPSKADSDKQQR